MSKYINNILILTATLAFFLLILFSGATLAQGRFSLTWWTVDGGGGTSTGSQYEVGGIIGQPDTGAIGSERFIINGGYWDTSEPSEPSEDFIYIPIVNR